jgi:hypothetical protein
MIRTYRDLSRLDTLDDRFSYLDLRGRVGETTFGFDRWMNQMFYTSTEWRRVRDIVLVRDRGCDLGVDGYEIYRRPTIHHMNPIAVDDLVSGNDDILDPEYLITVSLQTHNAIHYGTKSLLPKPVIERSPGDTRLW